jgi:hypothetical protein
MKKSCFAVLLVLLASPVWAQNLLVNPNFLEGSGIKKDPISVGWSWDNPGLPVGRNWHYDTESHDGDG